MYLISKWNVIWILWGNPPSISALFLKYSVVKQSFFKKNSPSGPVGRCMKRTLFFLTLTMSGFFNSSTICFRFIFGVHFQDECTILWNWWNKRWAFYHKWVSFNTWRDWRGWSKKGCMDPIESHEISLDHCCHISLRNSFVRQRFTHNAGSCFRGRPRTFVEHLIVISLMLRENKNLHLIEEVQDQLIFLCRFFSQPDSRQPPFHASYRKKNGKSEQYIFSNSLDFSAKICSQLTFLGFGVSINVPICNMTPLLKKKKKKILIFEISIFLHSGGCFWQREQTEHSKHWPYGRQ